MRHAESGIQQACVTWFRLQYPLYKLLFFAVPNGGARTALEASIMNGEGVTAGVSDMLLLVPSSGYHGLCVEFKHQCYREEKGKLVLKKTYQSPEQKVWQREVEAVGYKYAVIRTLEEFTQLIINYLSTTI